MLRNREMESAMNELNQKLSSYIKLRNGSYPFPVDSVLFFALTLQISSLQNKHGDLLEIGVEHGGTALLLAQYLKQEEFLHLIDLKLSERFSSSLKKINEDKRNNIIFYEESSRSKSLHYLDQLKFRYIHIDGGHSYDDVLSDAIRFANSLTDSGICVFDDFFEIRWPEVTMAVIDFLKEASIAPFLLVDRKLYCTPKYNQELMLGAVQTSLKQLDNFGTHRKWIEKINGFNTLIVKFDVNSETRKKFK